MTVPTFRFAPSPTGFLHLGHALSAIVGHDWARSVGGRFLLRIEDTDLERARPEFEAAIIEDLAWVGLASDGPVLRQSEHFETYRLVADRLAQMGLLYPCSRTRREIEDLAGPDAARDPDGQVRVQRMPETIEAVPGRAVQMRLDMTRALELVRSRLEGRPLTYTAIAPDGASTVTVCHPEDWGDVVLQRKGTPTSYHLACVVDDARQGVTHVTRGLDLVRATDLHRLLQVLLDLPAPLYHHHRLLLDESGRKLAKTRNSKSLRDLRADGWTAADMRRSVGAPAEI